jgi:copper(I)-binding protein
MLPRKKFVGCLFAIAVSAWGPVLHAHGVSKGDLLIDHPYATPSLKGTTNVSVYFRGIQNKGEQPDRLTGATSPQAQRVAMHLMSTQGSIMQMREVSVVDLPPNSTTLFRHNKGGYHLMLVGLKQALKDGDRFDITLTFERAGRQTVNVWVQTPRDAESEDNKH